MKSTISSGAQATDDDTSLPAAITTILGITLEEVEAVLRRVLPDEGQE